MVAEVVEYDKSEEELSGGKGGEENCAISNCLLRGAFKRVPTRGFNTKEGV